MSIDYSASSQVFVDIMMERGRHFTEGWTAEHDDRHRPDDLARAAACYALPPTDRERPVPGYAEMTLFREIIWPWADTPWADTWWKPKDRRRDLVRAAALIVAEIERLDRAAAKASQAEAS